MARVYNNQHPTIKVCPHCNKEYPRTKEFFYGDSRATLDGLSGYCKVCHNEQCKTVLRRDRKTAIEYYSQGKNACACCHEKIYEFLAIDHIDGGGNKHRKELAKGSAFYRWLRQQGWPKGFQVLCHNCNAAKGYYGSCPHQKEQMWH